MKHDLRTELERLLRQLEARRYLAGDDRFEFILELKRIIDFVLPRELAR